MPIQLLLLFCVVIWGWTFVATKICLAYLHPIELIGLRFGIGLPLLLAIISAQRRRMEFSRREYATLALGAAIIALHFIIQVIGLRYTSATNTAWIIAVSPLVMMVLSFLILKEHIGLKELTAIGIASAGVLLLISRGEFRNFGWLKSTGDWLVLASAHTWALYTIATRDVSRSRDPMMVTLAVFTPVTVLCLLYSMLFLNLRAVLTLPLDGWIALLFLGVLGTLTQWFWQIGVAKIGAARAGIFLYIEPVATTCLAIPLLHEPLPVPTIIGGLLVLVGVWWSQK